MGQQPADGPGFRPIDRFTETRRNLPHLQDPGRTYFLTFRVREGQLPEEAMSIAYRACLFWDGRKCAVHACVVMPDHVHLLLTPLPIPGTDVFHSLSELMHSIKSYSAHEINKLLKRRGPLWLDESYDRVMREEEDFLEKWNYIARNPVIRGLSTMPEDYPFLYQEGSGAVDAADTGGTPVPPGKGREGAGPPGS